MPPTRTRLKIPGMCAQGPPSYSELETNDRRRHRREAALAQVSQDATYCVHYSSVKGGGKTHHCGAVKLYHRDNA